MKRSSIEWLRSGLAMVVYAAVSAGAAERLASSGSGWLAGGAGAFAALFSTFVARSKVRTAAIGCASGALLLCVWLLHKWIITYGPGPLAILNWGMEPGQSSRWVMLLSERVLFLGVIFALGVGVRSTVIRRPAMAIVELLAVVAVASYLVVEHRHGALNRPFDLADPMITRGGDPVTLFFALGALAVLLAVLTLIRERNVGRLFVQLGLICAAVALFLTWGNLLKVPDARPVDDGLGLRGKGASKKKNRAPRNDPDQQLEFKDRYEEPPPNSPPVAVVMFEDDYSPPFGMYYFRQSAFSQYNGRRLVVSTRENADKDLVPALVGDVTRSEAPPELLDYRTSLETMVGLLADHNKPFGLEAPVEYERLENSDERRFRRVYRVKSHAISAGVQSMLGAEAGDGTWSKDLWNHYTTGPGDLRYAELANHIVTTSLPVELQKDPLAQALAITDWLGAQGKYSLKSGHASADDPTADFLFGDLTGYCVHFAHAATYLMRARGLPSRVATGYASPESNRQGGSALLLTGADSHAWPEVFIRDAGWLVVDVAPETVMSNHPPPPDPELQRMLGEMMRKRKHLPPTGPPLEQVASRHIAEVGRWIGITVLILVTAWVLGLYLIKVWRAVAPYLVGEKKKARLMYRAGLDRLSDVRIRRYPGEPQMAFALRVRRELPAFETLTREHLALKYGGKDPSLDTKVLRALHRDRKKVASRLHRWIGGLTPWTWLKSR